MYIPPLRNDANVTSVFRVEYRDTGDGMYKLGHFCSMLMALLPDESGHMAGRRPVPRNDMGLNRDALNKIGDEIQNVLGLRTFFRDLPNNLEKETWLLTVGKAERRPWFFGFPSLEAFNAWVPPHVQQYMPSEGLVLAIYETHPSACFFGDTQVVFHAGCARRVHVCNETA